MHGDKRSLVTRAISPPVINPIPCFTLRYGLELTKQANKATVCKAYLGGEFMTEKWNCDEYTVVKERLLPVLVVDCQLKA